MDYNDALTLDPNLAYAYGNRGLVYAEKGNVLDALVDFQKACDMGYEARCRNLQKALKKR